MSEMSEKRKVFICEDCGVQVYNAIEVMHRCGKCLTCQWLADLPDPLERELLRAMLKDDDEQGRR
jgi:hypothetical protein